MATQITGLPALSDQASSACMDPATLEHTLIVDEIPWSCSTADEQQMQRVATLITLLSPSDQYIMRAALAGASQSHIGHALGHRQAHISVRITTAVLRLRCLHRLPDDALALLLDPQAYYAHYMRVCLPRHHVAAAPIYVYLASSRQQQPAAAMHGRTQGWLRHYMIALQRHLPPSDPLVVLIRTMYHDWPTQHTDTGHRRIERPPMSYSWERSKKIPITN